MSRNIIQTHEPYTGNLYENTANGKVIITDYKNDICSFLIKENRLIAANKLENTSKIGNIYIAKVKNVVKNIDACFVEIANKEICFLPFKEAQTPFCINRAYDGRLVQGDELLVQVTKDALKTKQAGVSCNITLQNDYFVFAVGNSKIGISSKLKKADKWQITDVLIQKNIIDHDGQIIQDNLYPEYGMIVRTEAAKLFAEDLNKFLEEFAQLNKAFLQLFEVARHKKCFHLLRSRKMPYKSILDPYSITEYQEVVTDLNEAYTSLQGLSKPVRLYEDETYSLKKLYSIESKMPEALGKNIWLKSGAYLVIEQTECLNTIDVNSGKNIKQSSNAEATWQINSEAAKEAALQIRLRNLSGIIIIDFINMDSKEAEENLIQLMKKYLNTDPIATNVIDITPLGLMEITRKKVNKSLLEQFRGDL